MISILQARGHTVIAAQLNLASLADDVAWARHVLAERVIDRPACDQEHRWWSVDDLRDTSEVVWPRDLASLLATLITAGPPGSVIEID